MQPKKILCHQVLLHTMVDAMRNEEEREINHHGKSITVGGKQDIDTVPLFDAVKFEILLPSVQSQVSTPPCPHVLLLISPLECFISHHVCKVCVYLPGKICWLCSRISRMFRMT